MRASENCVNVDLYCAHWHYLIYGRIHSIFERETMKIKCCLLLATIVLAAPSYAAEPYMVGMFGIAKVDLDPGSADADLRAAGATNLTSSIEDRANFTRIGLGFKLSPQIAVEATYINSGDFIYRATFTQGSADVKYSAAGYGVSLLAFATIEGGITPYARLGLYNFTVDGRATIRATGVASASVSGNSLSPEIGAGLEITLSPKSALRIEYDFFSQVGDQDTTGKSDVSALSLGFLLRF
jgi:opacity protein-like surface antigen